MTSQNKGRTPPPFKDCKYDKTGETEKKIVKTFWREKMSCHKNDCPSWR